MKVKDYTSLPLIKGIRKLKRLYKIHKSKIYELCKYTAKIVYIALVFKLIWIIL
jgi:hypothetical protein